MGVEKIADNAYPIEAAVDAVRQIHNILITEGLELGMIVDGGTDGEPVPVIGPPNGSWRLTVEAVPALWAVAPDAEPEYRSVELPPEPEADDGD